MIVFPPPVSFSIQPYLGIVALLHRCQGEISEEIFKLIFSLLIPIMIIKTLKIRKRCVPFNLLLIAISIYVFTTKVKPREINSVHKDQRLPKNLSGSNGTQIELECSLKR